MSEFILKTENVTKLYGKFKALDNFSCEIPQIDDAKGSITGLLGPNGAGKTTFIHSLLGVSNFDSGTINCLDYQLPADLLKIKDIIGYMPERETTIHRTSAMKYVTHFGRLAGLPKQDAVQRAFDVLHYVGLEEARYRNLNEYSTGMIQRVKLATALVHDPILLVLDEPTAGMDPPGREKMLNLISDLGKNHNKFIIMSTHLLPDVEKTSNYVILINQGQQIMQGDLKSILKRQGDKVNLRIIVDHSLDSFASLLEEANIKVIETSPEISCLVDSSDDAIYLEIFRIAKENKFNIRKLTPYNQSLEDVFLDTFLENKGEQA